MPGVFFSTLWPNCQCIWAAVLIYNQQLRKIMQIIENPQPHEHTLRALNIMNIIERPQSKYTIQIPQHHEIDDNHNSHENL